MALPLAVVGLGGVLALVLLRGEQSGEQASGKPVQTTSRSTLVSSHRSQAVVVPTSSGGSGPEASPEGRPEVPEAVRSGQRETAAAVPPGAPAFVPSSAEERRRGEPRTHRHRPTPSTPPPPSTAPASTPADPSTSIPTSAPTETAPPTPTDTVIPEPAPSQEPIPQTPTSNPAATSTDH